MVAGKTVFNPPIFYKSSVFAWCLSMKPYRLVENVALTATCLVLIILLLIQVYPPIVGADASYTVLSGSMCPGLNPGDLIIVKRVDPSLIEVGDIVTVESNGVVFTHRVVEKKVENGIVLFKTKGDANEDPDPAYLEASQIIGKVILVIPFGYARTPYGFTFIMLVPALILMGRHMWKVYHATLRRNRRQLIKWMRRMRKSQTLDTGTITLTLILLIGATRVMAPLLQSRTVSYFYDEEHVHVYISAGVWVVEADVDVDPDTLNLESEGNYVTVYIRVAGYDMRDVDVSTVMLNDTIKAVWGEVQEDGGLMVKFDRGSVIDYLAGMGYGDGDTVKLKVSGRLPDGVSFEGYDTVKVVESKGG